MNGETRNAESGQASADYVIVVAAVAIGCALAILFLSGAINGLFGSSAAPIGGQAPLQPPVPSAQLTWPTSVADCEDGGWQDYPQFKDEAECKDYVDSLTP